MKALGLIFLTLSALALGAESPVLKCQDKGQFLKIYSGPARGQLRGFLRSYDLQNGGYRNEQLACQRGYPGIQIGNDTKFTCAKSDLVVTAMRNEGGRPYVLIASDNRSYADGFLMINCQ